MAISIKNILKNDHTIKVNGSLWLESGRMVIFLAWGR